MLLDPFMASLKSKTSSIDPYIKGEVWSLLSALEVPYTPEKNCQLFLGSYVPIIRSMAPFSALLQSAQPALVHVHELSKILVVYSNFSLSNISSKIGFNLLYF